MKQISSKKGLLNYAKIYLDFFFCVVSIEILITLPDYSTLERKIIFLIMDYGYHRLHCVLLFSSVIVFGISDTLWERCVHKVITAES